MNNEVKTFNPEDFEGALRLTDRSGDHWVNLGEGTWAYVPKPHRMHSTSELIESLTDARGLRNDLLQLNNAWGPLTAIEVAVRDTEPHPEQGDSPTPRVGETFIKETFRGRIPLTVTEVTDRDGDLWVLMPSGGWYCFSEQPTPHHALSILRRDRELAAEDYSNPLRHAPLTVARVGSSRFDGAMSVTEPATTTQATDVPALIRAHALDAGWDIRTLDPAEVTLGNVTTIHTGIHADIPAGHVGLILNRSSLGSKGLIVLGGVVDAGYRGEIIVKMGTVAEGHQFAAGDKVAQLVVIPLSNYTPGASSERGEDGFGSTGS